VFERSLAAWRYRAIFRAIRGVWPVHLSVLLLLVVMGCSRHGAEHSHLVTLHVADQLKFLQSAMESAGEDHPGNYNIEWSNFVGGPGIIAAETGGSVDIGWMAETPMVFAGAAGSPIRVIAVINPATSTASQYGLLVAPGSSIRTIRDLKGKKIAYMPGTVTQYYMMRLLARGGLTLSDIVTVSVPLGAVAHLLDTHAIDAAASADPLLSAMVQAGQAREISFGKERLTPGFSFLVAPETTLADEKLRPAIGDFIARVARSYKWERDNARAAAPTVARLYRVSQSVARMVVARSPRRCVPIDNSIIRQQQVETDAFLHAGLINRSVNVKAQFDLSFNKLVARVERAPL
jgi:sulfonate transport system substrate-binding protein